MDDALPKRRRGQHRRVPLSRRTCRRLLAAMQERAEAGDNAAAESLIRLSLTIGRDEPAAVRAEQ
jgi:hypothetical protein